MPCLGRPLCSFYNFPLFTFCLVVRFVFDSWRGGCARALCVCMRMCVFIPEGLMADIVIVGFMGSRRGDYFLYIDFYTFLAVGDWWERGLEGGESGVGGCGDPTSIEMYTEGDNFSLSQKSTFCRRSVERLSSSYLPVRGGISAGGEWRGLRLTPR